MRPVASDFGREKLLIPEAISAFERSGGTSPGRVEPHSDSAQIRE